MNDKEQSKIQSIDSRLLTREQSLANSELQMKFQEVGHLKQANKSERAYEMAEQAYRLPERLQLALEGSGDGLWDWNIVTGELYLSPCWLEMLGYGVNELPGYIETWEKLIHPEDKPWVMEILQAHLKDNSVSYKFDYRVLTKSAQWKWIANYGKVVVRSENGTPMRMAGTHRDISDYKRAEAELTQMSVALSNAVEGISQLDVRGRYVMVNQAYANMVGYKPEEMLGMAWQHTVCPEDLKKMTDAYQQMLSTGKAEVEAKGIRKNGSIFYKRVVLVAVYSEEKQFIGNYCFMKDISEKKHLEAQLLRAQRLESLGTLASGIAHDLNNLLTPVLATVQLLPLKLTNIDERTRELLRISEANIIRGASLLKQILSFSRGIEGKYVVLSVKSLFEEIEQIAQEIFPKAIDFYTHIPPNLWAICGDATQLHQVLLNLCLNARDAMPNGGILKLSAKNLFLDENYVKLNLDAKVGNYVVITVADTGTGISPEVLDRIFEPFFTTKELGSGTGLGLAIVANIVKSHGGFIDVYSSMKAGTKIKVFLPATEAIEEVPQNDGEVLLGNGELILVVDDEAAICSTTKTTLETYNYRVLIASNGVEAVAQYVRHRQEIDAVLMDIMMPTMDGTMAARALQQIDPQVEMIAVSGLVGSEQIASELGTIVKAFLSKPYTAQELLKTLSSILKHSLSC